MSFLDRVVLASLFERICSFLQLISNVVVQCMVQEESPSIPNCFLCQVWTKDLEQQAAVLQEQENSESQGSVEIPPMLVQVPLIHAR